MRGNRRAILVDILERNLDPKVAHNSTDKSGRMVNVAETSADVTNEKLVFASTQKVQAKRKVENVVTEEKEPVKNIADNFKPADIVEEQDGFLIPSIATKVANVPSIEESKVLDSAATTEEVVTTKKSRKKKPV